MPWESEWDTTWNCQSGRLSDSDPDFSIWDDDDVCFAPVSDSFVSDLEDDYPF